MKWRSPISKFSGRMSKEKWIGLLILGVFLMLVSMPLPGSTKETEGDKTAPFGGNAPSEEAGPQSDGSQIPSDSPVSAPVDSSYEAQLEARIREILKSVEGVGRVEVMVVLKSSGERVMRIDRSDSQSSTSETDSAGGSRQVVSTQSEESTVLTSGSAGGTVPVVEKELSPELSGIIISADGGGSPEVKAEISEAMEALFGLPAHKIKVLKRAG
ncbi:MAG: stage III sporulation protein AG [Clostridiales bacterium]|nr:stage III sporulation protein AG [Clostridiales bacterium]